MLIVLSGLPGTGKTTIGKALAAKRSAAYVRVDEIEHALKQHFGFDQEIGCYSACKFDPHTRGIGVEN